MVLKEFKVRIAAVFILSVLLTPAVRAMILTTTPEGSDFVLPVGRTFEIICSVSVENEKIERLFWETPWTNTSQKNITEVKITNESVKLVFHNPTATHSGTYYCRCKFQKSSTVEENKSSPREIKINFNGPYVKRSYFEDVVVEEGSTVKLKCSATGDSPTTYEWRDQYDNIISDTPYKSNIFASVSESENQSVLKIRELKSNEAGSYTCTGSNKSGQTRQEYEILIHPSKDGKGNISLPFIRHVQIVKQTENSVQFGISASGMASSIRVRYYTGKDFPDYTVYEKEWDRGDIYEVKGLVPGKSYFFRFMAIPQDKRFRQTSNDSLWSTELEVVMLPQIPEVVFHELTGGSVTVSWDRQNVERTVDKYKLRYLPIFFTNWNRKWDPFCGGCEITIEIPSRFIDRYTNYTISGLSSKTHYEIQVQAHNIAGYGEPYRQKIYVL